MVKKSFSKVLAILAKLGFDYQGTYEQRRMVHCIVYVLQEKGVKIGYAFTWQICGVFSRELAEDLRVYKGDSNG